MPPAGGLAGKGPLGSRQAFCRPKRVLVIVGGPSPTRLVVIVDLVSTRMDELAVLAVVIATALAVGGANSSILHVTIVGEAKALHVLDVALAVAALNARAITRVEHPVIRVASGLRAITVELSCPCPHSWVGPWGRVALVVGCVVVGEGLEDVAIAEAAPLVCTLDVVKAHGTVVEGRARHLSRGVIRSPTPRVGSLRRALQTIVVRPVQALTALDGRHARKSHGNRQPRSAEHRPSRSFRSGHPCSPFVEVLPSLRCVRAPSVSRTLRSPPRFCPTKLSSFPSRK